MDNIKINGHEFTIKPTPISLFFNSPITSMYDTVAELMVKEINGNELTPTERKTLEVYGEALWKMCSSE